MSEVYTTTPDSSRNILSAAVLGLLCVSSIFAVLPMLMTLPSPWDKEKIDTVKPISDQKPDDIPIEKVEPELPKPDLEKPEIEKPPHRMTLTMMESLINLKGTGNGIRVDTGFAFGKEAEDFEVFLTEQLDKKPRVLVAVKPLYPYHLQKSKTAGHATVQFVIGPDGGVSSPRVSKSTHRAFEQPAIDAIMKSKWQPGQKDGKNVYSQVSLEVKFTP